MASSHEDFRQQVIAEYRQRAMAGDFEAYPALEELCLSEDGYHPARAMVILAAYPKDQVAKSLLFIAKEHLSFWASTLKATDETTAANSGPTIIKIRPRYMDGPDLVEAATYIREILDGGMEGPFQIVTKLRKALRLRQED